MVPFRTVFNLAFNLTVYHVLDPNDRPNRKSTERSPDKEETVKVIEDVFPSSEVESILNSDPNTNSNYDMIYDRVNTCVIDTVPLPDLSNSLHMEKELKQINIQTKLLNIMVTNS